LSEVEYVGHTINKEGIHFTREKLDPVIYFCPLKDTEEYEEVRLLDACNTDMGAYLCQLGEGKNFPIAFLSKAFDDRIRKW
jgi:hypothetical protein